MTTLADFRGWLRLDLNDPAGAGQRFGDGDLDRAVAKAVGELTAVWPKVTDTEYTVPIASRTVALPGGTFPGLVEIEEVEHPYGPAGSEARFPAALVPFRLAPDKASMMLMTEEVPGAGTHVRIRWAAAHAVTAGGSTLPAELELTVTEGAAGHAMLAYSTPAADNFKYEDGATVAGVDDSMIPKEWRVRGEAYLARFREELGKLRRRRYADSRRMVSLASEHEAAVWPVAG